MIMPSDPDQPVLPVMAHRHWITGNRQDARVTRTVFVNDDKGCEFIERAGGVWCSTMPETYIQEDVAWGLV